MTTETTYDLLKHSITKLKIYIYIYIYEVTKRDYGFTLSQTDVCNGNKGYFTAVMDLNFERYY
jgi:hypothetical protein